MRRVCSIALLAFAAGCGRGKVQPVYEMQETYVLATNPPFIAIASERLPDPYHHPTESPTSMAHIVSAYGMDVDRTAGHGDGVTVMHFAGKTVEIAEDGLRPVPQAGLFHVQADGSPFRYQISAGQRLPRGSHSDANGDFRMPVQIGAAWVRLQSTNIVHAVGESGTARVWIEAEGFQPLVVDVSYCQPPTLVVLQRKRKTEPNQAPEDTSLHADPQR